MGAARGGGETRVDVRSPPPPIYQIFPCGGPFFLAGGFFLHVKGLFSPYVGLLWDLPPSDQISPLSDVFGNIADDYHVLNGSFITAKTKNA